MKNIFKLFLLLIFIYSCKSVKITTTDTKSFVLLNKLDYPSNSLFENNEKKPSVSNNLNAKELDFLENWNKESFKTENFNNSECIGCSTSFESLKFIYKIKNGNYIHFGLQSDIGIKNFLFHKSGKFITELFSFQGYSKSRLNKLISQGDKSALTSISTNELNKKGIYLEHLEYSNQNNNSDWYNTLLPLRFKQFIDFKDQKPEMRFIFKSGLFSFQGKNKNNQYRTINFFEPTFTLDSNTQNESVSVNGYLSDVSFYSININEPSKVKISIQSNLKDEAFDFSILNNTEFLTLDQYIANNKPVFNRLTKTLKKGSYLISVKNKHNGKIDDYVTPYYSLKIVKSAQE